MKAIELMNLLSEAIFEHGMDIYVQYDSAGKYYEVTNVSIAEENEEGEVRSILLD